MCPRELHPLPFRFLQTTSAKYQQKLNNTFDSTLAKLIIHRSLELKDYPEENRNGSWLWGTPCPREKWSKKCSVYKVQKNDFGSWNLEGNKIYYTKACIIGPWIGFLVIVNQLWALLFKKVWCKDAPFHHTFLFWKTRLWVGIQGQRRRKPYQRKIMRH